MKPVKARRSIYIDFDKKNVKESLKFKIGDNVRMSKYKNIFVKCYVSNWSEEVFVIKKVENAVPWKNVNSNVTGEKLAGTFYKKALQNKKTQRI